MSETILEKHYRETLEYIGDYAIKRDHIIYCDHIAQVVINKLKEGHNLSVKSSGRDGTEAFQCLKCGRDLRLPHCPQCGTSRP